MTSQASPKRAALKYALIQIPGIVVVALLMLILQRWLELATWLVWGVVLAWVIKDLALFPFVWRSYDPGLKSEAHSLVGQVGRVKEALAPSGYILVRGELWRARAALSGSAELTAEVAAVPPGAQVRVVAMEGLTLLVEPVAEKIADPALRV